jgi:hypothetical protein
LQNKLKKISIRNVFYGIFMPPPWNGRGHIVLPFVIPSFYHFINWFPFIISWTFAHI